MSAGPIRLLEVKRTVHGHQVVMHHGNVELPIGAPCLSRDAACRMLNATVAKLWPVLDETDPPFDIYADATTEYYERGL